MSQPYQPVPHSLSVPSWQEIADEMRKADLEVVAENLGLELDRYDKHKWRDGDHIISISGPLFMDWLADQGGRGAIDLVMHVQQVEFKEAVEWLSGQDLSRRPVNIGTYAHAEERESRWRSLSAGDSLEMPAANEHRWDAVRSYLVETRKLPAALVDRLHERGLVFADDHQNAVFVRHSLTANTWKRGEVTGASLRGTWGEANHFYGLVPGSVRNQGWFWVGAGRGPVRRVLLTESPIDAMSLAVLDKERLTQSGVTIYLSSDGSGGVPKDALKVILDQGGHVIAAFDADRAGELMAWRWAQQLPGVERLTPDQGKDWNERLVHPQGRNVGQQCHVDLGQLWRWYGAAHVLGRSEGYLRRITEVAREIVQGTVLSAKAKVAMERDCSAAANLGNKATLESSLDIKIELFPGLEMES